MLVAALAVVPSGAAIAEATTSGGFDPYNLIGTLLTPVLVVVLLLFGKLHTEADYQRLEADRDAEKEERQRLQAALTDRVIPALSRSSLVIEAILPMVQNEVRLRAAARAPSTEDE